MKKILIIVSTLLMGGIVVEGRTILTDSASSARAAQDETGFCVAEHNIGKMTLVVQNTGRFGVIVTDYEFIDCFTNKRLWIGNEYPKGSLLEHIKRMALWVGGIVGDDTLVSTGAETYVDWNLGLEFRADPGPAGSIRRRSTLDPDSPEFAGAVSEQDFITVYTDTFISIFPDQFSWRLHKPLNLEITQRSYAWSYGYAEDFIIFDLSIKNIGDETITNLYFGLYLHYLIAFVNQPRPDGDLTGFLRRTPSFQECGFVDSLDMVWFADNDGDPYQGEFIDHVVSEGVYQYKSCSSVNGVRFLRQPSPYSHLTYNWWARGTLFTPRHRDNSRIWTDERFDYPAGDLNRYHVLSNGEIDYDLAYTASVLPWDPVWLYPSNRFTANSISAGNTPGVVFSTGPVKLDPGSTMPVVFAIVAGENFHTDPNNLSNLPHDPDAYYANLDFSDLARNAMWASWIYDNPGVDTDGDGYFGKHRICVLDSTLTDTGWVATEADTAWYEGDGIPDWKAAGPPPAPIFWVEPTVNGLHVRFNGSQTETARDLFTGIVDFEGYHIWLGRDDREQSYSLVASYDNENYDKFIWDANLYPEANFVLHDIPYTVEQLRCLYGDRDNPCADSAFDPMAYTRTYPYYHPDFPESTFYFASHNHNASDLGLTSSIRKVYPDELPPPQNAHPDSLTPDRYTEDGYLKYYEYEFTIQNLLPTVPYHVNVTTFDFGSPQEGLNPLETSKTVGQQFTYPYGSDGEMSGSDNRVYVYPNPYRIDGEYRRAGYEGRMHESLPDDKVRSVHFANLPPRCIIRVYSLDGDLVREIKHYRNVTDGDARDDEWNLVNRNRQLVVSGMYYWSVENLDSGETQMGKLVILM